ncbi:MAG: membrane protein DedA with SNARE-associated domain [Planctomycetota bacterium]|jgi:membrane protein DedA with SNARE-associated domain
MESLIASYGYLVMLLGTLAEGETALLGGGYAVHQGWLDLLPMLVAAFVGAFGGDQMFFLVGRRHGRRFFSKRPRSAARVAQLSEMLNRHETTAIVGFRFLYGLRVATPIALGMAGVNYSKYLALTALSGIVWTLTFGLGGYYLGEAMKSALGNIQRIELYGFAAILMTGLTVMAARTLRKRRISKEQSHG